MSNQTLPLKALILAAGEGSRLRPLTTHTPKPLLPIMGQPMLALNIQKVLKTTPIKDISVNAFYLNDKIQSFCNSFHTDIYCSVEQSKIDTGGAVDFLKPWIKQDHLLVHSGDVISTMDLNLLIAAHFQHRAAATIFVVPHIEGETALDVQSGKLLAFNQGDFTFANAYILSPEFIQSIPQGKSGIIETFKTLLKQGRTIQALNWNGYWNNLNEIKDYFRIHEDILKNQKLFDDLKIFTTLHESSIPFQSNKNSFIAWPDHNLQFSMKGHVIVQGKCTIDSSIQEPIQLENCIVMPEASIDQVTIQNKIIGPDYTIQLVAK